MATSLSAQILVNLAATYTDSRDLGDATDKPTVNTSYSFTNGTGADQAQVVFSDTRTLSSSTSESLDLYGGLTDAFGNTINFAAVKGILVKAASGNGDTISVGPHATAGFTTMADAAGDKFVVRPGGLLLLVANDATGYAVTDSTADILEVTNNDSGASADYDIVLIGE